MKPTTAQQEKLGTHELVLTRQLQAPLEAVFKAWTEKEQLEQWWGPKGYTLEAVKHELQPGGIFHYCMKNSEGAQMWGRFRYLQIQAPLRLVFINSFSDAEGGLTRAPFNVNWPLEMHKVLSLTKAGTNTEMELRVRAFNASHEEDEIFGTGFSSMQQGFGGTFDQLEAHLRHWLATATHTATHA